MVLGHFSLLVCPFKQAEVVVGQQAAVSQRDVAHRKKDCFGDCEKKKNCFSDLKNGGNIGSVSGPIFYDFFDKEMRKLE